MYMYAVNAADSRVHVGHYVIFPSIQHVKYMYYPRKYE